MRHLMKIVSPGWLRCTLCAAVVLVVTGCGTQTAGGDSRSAASDDARAVLKDAWMYYHDPYGGIHVEGKFTPDRDGTTTGAATIEMAGRSITTPFLYPPNWDTDQWPPDPHQSLRSGHPMAVNMDVRPVCDGEAHDPPLISVPYRTADGTEATLQVAIAATRTGSSPMGPPQSKSVAETTAFIDDATRQFCSHGVFVMGGAAVNPEKGYAWDTYTWINPGPAPVTVMSKAWQGPNGSRWLPASPIEVPADGQEHKLTVHGVDGVCDEPHQTPMSLGLLVITYPDGESKVIQRPEEMYECPTRDGPP
jgi:hypothetical protein